MAIRIYFSIIFSLLLCTTTQLCASSPWQLGAYISTQYANISGFQQTPKGGTPGSTSIERPTFDELHIQHDFYVPFGAWLMAYDYQLSVDYLPMHYSGETILSSALTTHDIPLAQGRSFQAKVDDNLYSISLAKHFPVTEYSVIALGIVGHALEHHYEFQSGGFSSTRAFWGSSVGLLGMLHTYLTKQVTLTATIKVPTKLTNLDVVLADLSLGYLYRLSNHLVIQPYVQAGWHQITFKDKQTIPNYLNTKLQPVWGAGFDILLH